MLDKAFEPFIDELLENSNYECCQELIEKKKFHGDQEPCPNFEAVELIEIDDNSSLGQELQRLSADGELSRESFEQALLEEEIRNIDWKTMPMDQYAAQLQSSQREEIERGVSSLGAMMALGNTAAFDALFQFFNQLPPPGGLEEVHFKIKLLKHLERWDAKSQLILRLIDELYQTPSNNTTRQWISAIFRFLSRCPIEEIREPLEKMLDDKRFSHRLKKKIRNILKYPYF